MKEVLVVLNGIYKNKKEQYKNIINSFDIIIAVDGGYKFLKNIINYEPDIIIGDFDSLDKSSPLLKNFEGEIYEFSSDKDKTDGELALDYCKRNDYKDITLIGATGGRIDQQFGNITLLEYALESEIKAKIMEPGLEIGITNDRIEVKGKENYTLSIFSLSDKVFIKKLQGVKYELKDYWLNRASSRGISNVIKDKTAVIKVDNGILLYFLCETC